MRLLLRELNELLSWGTGIRQLSTWGRGKMLVIETAGLAPVLNGRMIVNTES
jgi:hypothetical protein